MKRVIIYVSIIFFARIIETNAQSVGFGYGIVGIQNYGVPEHTVNVSVLFEFNEIYACHISLSNWSGIDNNFTLFRSNPHYPNSNSYFGNTSIGFSFLYKYYATEELDYCAGVGLNQYEKIHKYFGTESYSFEPAISVTPLFINYNLNKMFSLYASGSVSLSTENLNPNWGSLIIGIIINPTSTFKK